VTPLEFNQHLCARKMVFIGYHAALTAWRSVQSL